MKNLLVLVAITAAVILLGAIYLQFQPRQAVTREAWVNMFVECPDSPDYGDLIDPDAPMWRDFNHARLSDNVPHGEQVGLLIDDPDANDSYRVRRNGGAEGYIPAQYLSDYDPANGVQPNESECAN